MRQFEIWQARLAAPSGTRPVLLLSRNSAYQYLNKFIIAEITTTIRNIPIEVALGPTEGLPKKCVVNCDNIRTVARQALIKRLGDLQPLRHREVKRAVGYALGWDELMEVG